MTDDPRRQFHCPMCGWETKTPPHVVQVFHPCSGERRQLEERPASRYEQDREWALGVIGEAIADNLDQEVLLRKGDHTNEQRLRE